MKNSKKFWLVTTSHLEDHLLFRDFEDFCVGMNYVAVQAFKTGVLVVAFILMSNHLHFVLFGRREQVEQFVNGFKTAYSRYYWDKYGVRELLRRNQVDFSEIDPETEALEWAIAYVQMNCVAANICAWPVDYPWGTGGCFFSLNPPDGRSLASLSARERYRILHTKVDLPGEWVLRKEGFIAPSSYVRREWVEERFKTPQRMNYFLRNSSKAKVWLEAGEKNLPAFRDQVILTALPDLCRSLFRKEAVAELGEEQLVELMRQLRFRFAANVNQIARVTGVSYERAAKLLDRA